MAIDIKVIILRAMTPLNHNESCYMFALYREKREKFVFNNPHYNDKTLIVRGSLKNINAMS